MLRRLDFEIDGELVENEVGGHPGLQITARPKIGEAEVEDQSRPRTPGDIRLVRAGSGCLRDAEAVGHAQCVCAARGQAALHHAQFGLRAAAEIVLCQRTHRDRRAIQPGP